MAGTVGPPLPSTDMRLEAVPEMNYDPTGNPPRGEIMFKGPSVFSGYYKDDEKTTEVIPPPSLPNLSMCFVLAGLYQNLSEW